MKNCGPSIHKYLVGGIPTPLKNDGLRQLGWLFHSQVNGKKSCSKPPTRKYYGISWIFNRHVHRFSMVFSWFSHGFPMVFPWIPKRPTDLCVLSWKNSGRTMASPRTLKSSGTCYRWQRGSAGAVEFWAKSGNIYDVYYYWKRRKTQKSCVYIYVHIIYVYKHNYKHVYIYINIYIYIQKSGLFTFISRHPKADLRASHLQIETGRFPQRTSALAICC